MNLVPTSEIAVIIVNFNTAAMTLAAIESVISRVHGGRTFEIHAVDNASPLGDSAVLSAAVAERNWTSSVFLHLERENHGFGRANNLVLKELANRPSPPRYVFLLNPDAQLENEAVAVLADFLDRHPDAGAAGARISRPDGSGVSAAFRFPGLMSTFISALALGVASPFLSRWRVPLPANTQTMKVDWVAGAAVMFRPSILEEVGYFDPRYFLYYEEVDLMRRIGQSGHEVWHVSEARVTHVEGAATGVRTGDERRRRPGYWYQSWRHYFLTNHGRIYALAASAAWMLGVAGNHVAARIRGRTPAAPLCFYRDFWTGVVRPLLSVELPRG